ncbi:hypothetical protein [Phytomonospora endophytica]|uniref:Uncharacterized protein n=1 Tax=Phytomonospora endophytica TaxID=714109 RepID=A0A841G2I1_9ACTN|nr:hypothetical protein [Phytomonospora endophytica]MBB6039982.1 hypothetical protein [Phytomonospora endophytica]GIG69811.1 hypothetical protein Pen01_61060 [Phytomonospora endophytica]
MTNSTAHTRVHSAALGFVQHPLSTGPATEDQLRAGRFPGDLKPPDPLNTAFLGERDRPS